MLVEPFITRRDNEEFQFGGQPLIMIYYCCDKLLINGNNYSFNGRDKTVCSSAVRYFFDVFVSFVTPL